MVQAKIIKMLKAVADQAGDDPDALSSGMNALLDEIAGTLGTFIGAASSAPAQAYMAFEERMSNAINAAVEIRLAEARKQIKH